MSNEIICKSCGHYGEPGTVTKGSFAIEVILWLCFLVPGLIYSVWRVSSRADNCSMCGGTDLVPTDSPIGRKLLAEVSPQAVQATAQPYRPTTGKKGGLAWRLGRLIAGATRK
jgi:hypothetical protein